MIRLAIIGAAHIHLHDVVSLVDRRPDLEVVTIIDHDEVRAQAWASLLGGATAATKIDDASGVDGFLVYGEPSRRQSALDRLMPLQRPIFVEKPFALTFGNSLTTVPADTHVQVGHFLRYWVPLRRMQDELEKGTIGDLTKVDVEFTHQGDLAGWFEDEFKWMADPAEGGDGFFDLAIHCVDTVYQLAGPIESVVGRRRSGPNHGSANLALRSGIKAHINAGWGATEMTIRATVTGTDGVLEAHGGELWLEQTPLYINEDPPAAETAIEAWVERASYHRGEPLVPLEDVLEVTKVMDALRAYPAA